MRLSLTLITNLMFLLQNVYTKENNICGAQKCIQKCCRERQTVWNRQCKDYNGTLEIENYSVYNENIKKISSTLNNYFIVKPGAFENVTFMQKTVLANFIYDAFYLIENGTMLMIEKQSETSSPLIAFSTEEFCLDYHMQNNNFSIKAYIIPKSKHKDYKIRLLLFCSITITCSFLVLVLVVYSLLQELRTLGGMMLMGYVASLLLAFIFLALMQSRAFPVNEVSCVSITLIIYYFFISSFCWMNVMSYDIWWTFRGYAKARPIHRRGIRFKFVMYCLYSLGLPLMLTILTGVMTNRDIPGVIVPKILLYGCFLEDKAKLVYLYGPMLIMIVVNWALFGMTVFNIWRLSRGTNVIDAADSSVTGNASAHRTHKHRLIVYIKLTVLMGLSWLFEVVSFFKPDWEIWYLTDTYNMLIGFVIFVIFICKKKIFKKLKQRFQELKSDRQLSSTISAKTQSTSK